MTLSRQLFADNAKTTLSASVSAVDTTLPVVDASVFPTPSQAGEFFKVTLEASGVLEIVYVYGKSGNTLTNCVRAREGKTAVAWPGGTRVENRATAKTFTDFVTVDDRLGEIASVDLLDPPNKSNGNSYLCFSTENAGNPIVAVKNTATTWRFLTHPTVLLTGQVVTYGVTNITSTMLAGFPTPVTGGRYIIQFLDGPAAGLCRIVTQVSGLTLQWATALPTLPISGTTFQVYRSTSSSIEELAGVSGDEGLIYSILLNE